MIKSIRHLSGTSLDWANASPFIVPRGELAVEYCDTGKTVIRVGDGVTPYEELAPINSPRTVFPDECDITLREDCIYSFYICTYLHIGMPRIYGDSFSAEVSFVSGKDPTEISFSEPIFISGDDTADNLFLPKAKKRYTVWIWYTDVWNAVVRGVPYD